MKKLSSHVLNDSFKASVTSFSETKITTPDDICSQELRIGNKLAAFSFSEYLFSIKNCKDQCLWPRNGKMSSSVIPGTMLRAM